MRSMAGQFIRRRFRRPSGREGDSRCGRWRPVFVPSSVSKNMCRALLLFLLVHPHAALRWQPPQPSAASSAPPTFALPWLDCTEPDAVRASGLEGWGTADLAAAAKTCCRQRTMLRAQQAPSSVGLTVVGVMSSLTNFQRRLAIRRTWASSMPAGAVLVFIVGRPGQPESGVSSDGVDRGEDGPRRDSGGNPESGLPGTGSGDSSTSALAAAAEASTYGDVLTVPTEEGYDRVLEKALHFLDWVTACHDEGPVKQSTLATALAPHHRLGRVIKVDDDTYLRVRELLLDFSHPAAPRERHYHGQLWTGSPIRDERHKNWVGKDRYPLETFPPYASGAHYSITVDVARYIVANEHFLRAALGMRGGNLEDVQVGLWLFGLGIRPVHDSRFHEAHNCHRRALSLSNVPDAAGLGMDDIWHELRASKQPCSRTLRLRAADFYAERHQLNPHLPESMGNQGVMLFLAGETGAAIRTLEAAVELEEEAFRRRQQQQQQQRRQQNPRGYAASPQTPQTPQSLAEANLRVARRYTEAECDQPCKSQIMDSFEDAMERFSMGVAATYWSRDDMPAATLEMITQPEEPHTIKH